MMDMVQNRRGERELLGNESMAKVGDAIFRVIII